MRRSVFILSRQVSGYETGRLLDFARFPAVDADRLSDSPHRFYNLRFELWPLAACLVLGGWFVLRIFWM